MIHDVLLSCLNLHAEQMVVEQFIKTDAVANFLHPCESKILEDIIKIINALRDVAKFAKTYGTYLPTEEPDSKVRLPAGLYLKAFSHGLDEILTDYYTEISDLERRYLQNPTHTLLFIYQRLQIYEPLALHLKKLISGIQNQSIHGCAIIQYVHHNILHGDPRISEAMKVLYSAVNVVFLKQLTHWILYAKIIDPHNEFFIQCCELRDSSTLGSEKATSSSSAKVPTISNSDTASSCTDIWRYEIYFDFLPYYLSSSWAEKVLFIGQTVLLFKADVNASKKSAHSWDKADQSISSIVRSLWNENEHFYFGKMQELQQDLEPNVTHHERVIDEIKCFVTKRLSEIAVNQADLVQQLKLVKDFYLLGRGELYLEFIRRTQNLPKTTTTAQKLSDYVKAFELAAHGVGIFEECEQFTLSIPKACYETDEVNEFGYMQFLQLNYKIHWPLHLLFSPKVIERYNVLFRFLLLIKKLQFELHSTWLELKRDPKINVRTSKAMHLRNQLMFLVDNLQYYIQVDVLESQFSILMNTVLNKADFEQIQRAHSVFQANILALCFLITEKDETNFSLLNSTLYSNNPVYIILNDIFYLCEDFCALITAPDITNMEENIVKLDQRFFKYIDNLLGLLCNLKSTPSTTPLAQLLLRLDFNQWFSAKKKAMEVD